MQRYDDVTPEFRCGNTGYIIAVKGLNWLICEYELRIFDMLERRCVRTSTIKQLDEEKRYRVLGVVFPFLFGLGKLPPTGKKDPRAKGTLSTSRPGNPNTGEGFVLNIEKDHDQILSILTWIERTRARYVRPVSELVDSVNPGWIPAPFAGKIGQPVRDVSDISLLQSGSMPFFPPSRLKYSDLPDTDLIK